MLQRFPSPFGRTLASGTLWDARRLRGCWGEIVEIPRQGDLLTWAMQLVPTCQRDVGNLGSGAIAVDSLTSGLTVCPDYAMGSEWGNGNQKRARRYSTACAASQL